MPDRGVRPPGATRVHELRQRVRVAGLLSESLYRAGKTWYIGNGDIVVIEIATTVGWAEGRGENQIKFSV